MTGPKQNRKVDFQLIEKALNGSYGYEPGITITQKFDKNNWYYTATIKPNKTEMNHLCKSVTMEDVRRLRRAGFVLLGVWFEEHFKPGTWSSDPRVSDAMYAITVRIGREDESHKWNLIY